MATGAKGWRGTVRVITDTYLNTSTAGRQSMFVNSSDPYVKSNPINTTVPLDKIFTIGTRAAIDIVEGEQEVTGSLERNFYVNESDNAFVRSGNASFKTLREVSGIYGDALTKCAMQVNLEKNSSTQLIYIFGIKFHDWSITLSAGDMIMESVTWDATNISSTVPEV